MCIATKRTRWWRNRLGRHVNAMWGSKYHPCSFMNFAKRQLFLMTKNYTKNLNPFFATSSGIAMIAPSTCSPLSSFLFSLPRMIRRSSAQHMAMMMFTQFTVIAATLKKKNGSSAFEVLGQRGRRKKLMKTHYTWAFYTYTARRSAPRY